MSRSPQRSPFSRRITLVSGFAPSPVEAMQVSPETFASSFFGLVTLGMAAGGVAGDNLGQGDEMITWGDHVLSFLAGLVGGFLFLRGVVVRRWPERALALLTSASWGAMFAPAMVMYAGAQAPWLKSGGPLLLLPVAAAIGAFMPHIYGLTSAFVEAARHNPEGIADFLAKVRKLRSTR